EPHISIGVGGEFVVAWRDYVNASSGVDIFARRLDSSGTPQGSDFQVNSYTPGSQLQSTVSASSASGFVVAWRSQYQDGSSDGVFAQRLGISTLATLDIDGNGVLAPLTDGLLVLRARFSFTGTTLTNNAIGPN